MATVRPTPTTVRNRTDPFMILLSKSCCENAGAFPKVSRNLCGMSKCGTKFGDARRCQVLARRTVPPNACSHPYNTRKAGKSRENFSDSQPATAVVPIERFPDGEEASAGLASCGVLLFKKAARGKVKRTIVGKPGDVRADQGWPHAPDGRRGPPVRRKRGGRIGWHPGCGSRGRMGDRLGRVAGSFRRACGPRERRASGSFRVEPRPFFRSRFQV